VARPDGQLAFSPELRYVVYLERPAGALPGDSQGRLLVTDLETGETIGEYPQAYDVYGWSADSERFGFLTDPQSPRVLIGQFDGGAVPAHDDPSVTTIDLRWIDANRYFFLASTSQGWSLLLGEIGGRSTVVTTISGRPIISYDFAR
jgi:hypothetical protein